MQEAFFPVFAKGGLTDWVASFGTRESHYPFPREGTRPLCVSVEYGITWKKQHRHTKRPWDGSFKIISISETTEEILEMIPSALFRFLPGLGRPGASETDFWTFGTFGLQFGW